MTIQATDNRRVIYHRPDALTEKSTHYCPGCGHGIVHRLVGELFDEMNLAGRTIGVGSVGCSVFAYDYFNIDFVEFDSTGRLAKAKTTCGVRVLNTKEDRRPESVLYWKKTDGNWYLDLRTTLERGSAVL